MGQLNYKYKQFGDWEKFNLERYINRKPVFKKFEHLDKDKKKWVIGYKFLIDINPIAKKLNRSWDTIKNELIRGCYPDLKCNSITWDTEYYYSKDASDTHHKKVINKRAKQQLKIFKHPELITIIKEGLDSDDSLKCIGDMMVNARKEGKSENSISAPTLYAYSKRKEVDFINSKHLIYGKMVKRKEKKTGKYQRGPSIDEMKEEEKRPTEPGHYEGDTIEGSGKYDILVLHDVFIKYTFLIKVLHKSALNVVSAMYELQNERKIIYGETIKTLLVDNGVEFAYWKYFSRDIINNHDIHVYFTHPYCSTDKPHVENQNRMSRRYLKKGMNFDDISPIELKNIQDKINKRHRKSLNYKSPMELYNQYVQVINSRVTI